jgi:hypothetical protein
MFYRILKTKPMSIRIANHQLPHPVNPHYRLLYVNALRPQIFVSVIQLRAIKIEPNISVDFFARGIKRRWPAVRFIQSIQHQIRPTAAQQGPIKLIARPRLHSDFESGSVAIQRHGCGHVENLNQRSHARELNPIVDLALVVWSGPWSFAKANDRPRTANHENLKRNRKLKGKMEGNLPARSERKNQADPLCRVTGRE